MAPLPIIVLNACVAGAVIVAILYTLAVFVRCALEVHQLKVDTHRLRIAYLDRVRALRAGNEPIEVEIVEDPESGENAGESPALAAEAPVAAAA